MKKSFIFLFLFKTILPTGYDSDAETEKHREARRNISITESRLNESAVQFLKKEKEKKNKIIFFGINIGIVGILAANALYPYFNQQEE